jgi:DNA-binding GntR family transcriptional regulator
MEIHRYLREAILRGDLGASTNLSQVKLAASLGVSRGPVREALRLLQREGLVEAEVNRRVRVAAFSVDDLEQLYSLRIVNETLGVRASVPHLTDEDMVDQRQAIEDMEGLAGDTAKIADWEAAHRRFHHSLVAYSGRRLVSLIEQLSDHAERYRLVYTAQDPRAWSVGAAEHREISAWCERRDAGAAGDALARHLARTAFSVLAHRAPDHDPTLVRSALRSATDSPHPLRPDRVALQRP